ncbi:MAG: hypothetical protein FH748_05550 [Balneolaceae bacterium]|nr:hypothetical protein [Balneolaceae bacterium]
MYRLCICLTVITVMIGGCQPKSSQSSNEITESVNSLLNDYQAFMSSGNVDSLVNLYSNDPRFHWVEDGKTAYSSPKEIEKGLKGLQRIYSQSHLELSNTKVTPLPPDYALITTHFKQSLADSTGIGFSFSGIMTITAVKEHSGWKFLIGHVSSPKQR